MDPLHVAIALLPLAMYLLLIGSLNASTRPFLTTGARDSGALALAISGFVIVGPMELFLPESVASIIGGWVWLPMLSLYVLIAILFLLLARPRLVIYNMSVDQVRPLLKQAVSELDREARWAGDCVILPSLGVQMAIEGYTGVRNVCLTSIGIEQDLEGWRKLEHALRRELVDQRQTPSAQGMSYVFLAIMMTVLVTYSLVTGRQEIAQTFREMLRM